jgi:hypothetical protein
MICQYKLNLLEIVDFNINLHDTLNHVNDAQIKITAYREL